MSDSIESLSAAWLDLLKAKEDQKAVDFYCQQIVPAILPGLQAGFREKHGREPRFDALVSLLGFTPETVVLAYLFTTPKAFAVLHTKETAHLLDQVVRYTQVPIASFFHEPFEEEPLRDIYLALERALRRFPRGAKIAIELTGGKKTMGGALAVAAGMLDIDLIYIDYRDYMPAFRKPMPSSTYIHLVENPMKASVDLFGGLEIERALEFFNLGKLEASEELLSEAAKRMGNPRVAEFCAGLARFYSSWNAFDFAGATKTATELFETALRFHQDVASTVTFNLHRLKLQLDTVQKLAASERRAMLLNFFFTAERYESNAQHDIAALLYYRAIEDTFANRLQDRLPTFKRDSPDYSLCNQSKDELVMLFNEARARLIKGAAPVTELPERLALLDTCTLLDALKDECFSSISRPRLVGLAEVRNHSIFAHGIRPMTAASIAGLKKLAKECLEAYLQHEKAEILDHHREYFTFMELTLLGQTDAAQHGVAADGQFRGAQRPSAAVLASTDRS